MTPPRNATYTITVLPDGLSFQSDSVSSVLESGLVQGVELQSSCRNGTCRACICKLVSGQLRYRVDWPGLSADEKSEGWCLPCVAVAQSDLLLEQPFASATESQGSP